MTAVTSVQVDSGELARLRGIEARARQCLTLLEDHPADGDNVGDGSSPSVVAYAGATLTYVLNGD